ncbi:hypothetical protein JCM30760_26610 [Thiomicrorhabdus hydrogeniphila]
MIQAFNSYIVEFNLIKVLEILGAVLGATGALIMSFAPEIALIAWSLWLLSTICLGAFAYKARLPFLFMLQIVFFVINLTGVYNNI